MTVPTDARLHALAREVAVRLETSQRWLATAESCTGGWIAKVCTDLPGSSNWFLGGAVVYSNDAKTSSLGVKAETLLTHGAVSEPVIREMATGVLERFGSDLSVAVSGVAGPTGGTVEKPVGTVWFAWARRSGSTILLETARELFGGNRDAVRRLTGARALERLQEL